MGYNERNMNSIFSEYDIIVPMPEKICISVYEQYITSKYHHKKDIDLVINIIKEKHPHMMNVIERYMYGDNAYYGNMYVMKWKVFDHYIQIVIFYSKRIWNTIVLKTLQDIQNKNCVLMDIWQKDYLESI